MNQEEKGMEQIAAFRVDLNKIEGDGEFPCPSCGTLISPDDESNTTYEIIDVKTEEDGSPKSLNILCKMCGNTIIIEGFEALNEFDDLNEEDRL